MNDALKAYQAERDMLITLEHIIRNDGVFAAQWIESLHYLIREIERKIQRRPRYHSRGSLSQLQSTREKQLESMRELCRRMQAVQPKFAEFTGLEPLTPSTEIELFFSLVNP